MNHILVRLVTVFIILGISLIVFGCSVKSPGVSKYNVTKASNISEIFEHVANVKRVQEIIDKIPKGILYKGEEKYCKEYKDEYKPRVLFPAKISEPGNIKDDHIIWQTYSLSKLKNSKKTRNKNNCYSPGLYQDVIASMHNKDMRKDLKDDQNFAYNLNSFLKKHVNDTGIIDQVKSADDKIFQDSIQKVYNGAMHFLFKVPESENDDFAIGHILFNLFVPFGNKIHCVMFDKEKKNFCENCQNIKDLFECCSKDFSIKEDKDRWEKYILDALEFTRNTIKKRNPNLKFFSVTRGGNYCFDPSFTVDSFWAVFYEYMARNPM